jgi:hypothetical protein
MQILRDFFGFFSNVRRIREAMERLAWPQDVRRQDIYRARTFRSER